MAKGRFTGLTDPVTIGGLSTTILAEFRRQRSGAPTVTPTVRLYHDNKPTSICYVTVWIGHETATFLISAADFAHLMKQGARID